MHPAFSVIFFTITSGLGYGLLIFSALMGLTVTELALNPQHNTVLLYGVGLGVLFVSLGFMSSVLHLANPKNAWRAFFRFKSSWLAKEGVYAVLSYPIALAFMAAFYFGFSTTTVQVLAVALMVISVTTIFATGMIYACLKTITAWNTALVPVNYIVLGLLSGGLFFLSLLAHFDIYSGALEVAIFILLFVGLVSKVIYYFFIGKPSKLSVKTATGLASGVVRLLDTGESSDNFLTKEFGYQVSVRAIYILQLIALGLIAIVPAALLIYTRQNELALMAAVAINYAGIFIERWLFFAQAKHVVNLYYGREA